MVVQDLQVFLESPLAPGGCVPVDLLRIARSLTRQSNNYRPQRGNNKNQQTQPGNSGLSLVIDAECCLDRLYGGYFSDWACGGQWNRMVQFLVSLVQTLQSNNIHVAVFFNGALEQQRMSEWVASQQKIRLKVGQVLRHVNSKGTPPPKVWWNPPICLRTCLRMALRHLNITTYCTMDDHHQEVIAYCRENEFTGLMADDGEYVAFDPPRYFSGEHLKLTFKGSLETKEFVLTELNKVLNLTSERLCVLAALLGNYLLSEHDLIDLYHRLGIREQPGRIPFEELLKTMACYVANLPAATVENLDLLAEKVFGGGGKADGGRSARLKQSVQYYLNGTDAGFLRYRPQQTGGRRADKSSTTPTTTKPVNNGTSVDAKKEKDNDADTLLDYTRLASETKESEQESLAAYKQVTANAPKAPQIVIEPPTAGLDAPKVPESAAVNGSATLLPSSSSSSSSSSSPSPSRVAPEEFAGQSKPSVAEEKPMGSGLPSVSTEVMRTACERHSKGLMSPWIYQILTQGEVRFPILMEDENHKEFPSIHHIYRPVRQMVYAILFNVHHSMYMASKGGKEAAAANKQDGGTSDQSPASAKAEIPQVRIKEWIWTKPNPYTQPDIVSAEQIGWGVPTIQRLWFGGAMDDKRRRLRAFLTCMRSDTPLMLNQAYVPQHLLVLAVVLRYIMTIDDPPILRKPELDAFIAQAFSPELMNSHFIQELQLNMVSSRGVQLASLFMAGVENALVANDACGSPLPWLMCCPWLYFDGKLFHHKLGRTGAVKNLLELCDHRLDLVVLVEKMRMAILEGLDTKFASPSLPQACAPESFDCCFNRDDRYDPARIMRENAPIYIRTGLGGGDQNTFSGGGIHVTMGVNVAKHSGVRVPMRHGLPPPGPLIPAGAPVWGNHHSHGPPSRMPPNAIGRGQLLRRPVPARGGQLEIAGVVVGSWGPNYGSRGGNGGQAQRMPQSQPNRVRPMPPQASKTPVPSTVRELYTRSDHCLHQLDKLCESRQDESIATQQRRQVTWADRVTEFQIPVTSVGGMKNYRNMPTYNPRYPTAGRGSSAGGTVYTRSAGGGRGAKKGAGARSKKKTPSAAAGRGRALTVDLPNGTSGVVKTLVKDAKVTPPSTNEESLTLQMAALSGQFEDATPAAKKKGAAPIVEVGQGDGPPPTNGLATKE